MDLIHNERIKLLATFINGIAIAVFALGGLAPISSALYGTSSFQTPILINSAVCLVTAFGVHYVGSMVLTRMRS